MSDIIEHTVAVQISVEPREDGRFDVVTRKNNKSWLRHGPFDTLDYANEICRQMLQTAKKVRDRYVE